MKNAFLKQVGKAKSKRKSIRCFAYFWKMEKNGNERSLKVQMPEISVLCFQNKHWDRQIQIRSSLKKIFYSYFPVKKKVVLREMVAKLFLEKKVLKVEKTTNFWKKSNKQIKRSVYQPGKRRLILISFFAIY